MYNDHMSNEEARELIRQRIQEAESYGRQKQLGFRESQAARWVFLLIAILAVVAVGVLL